MFSFAGVWHCLRRFPSGGAVATPYRRSAPAAFQILSRLFVFRPAEQFTREVQGFVLQLRVLRSFGNRALERLDQLATVEKIGPSSEASAASQSCSRRLTVFSGIKCEF